MTEPLDLSKLTAILHRTPIFFNPLTDFGFKKLFGEEANKDLLLDFLNTFIPAEHRIRDLAFAPTEALPDIEEERKAFFDIACKTEDGHDIIVEMQRLRLKYYKDRSLFCLSRPIARQARRKKNWNFELKQVYVISILDFDFDPNESSPKVLRCCRFRDQDNEVLTDKANLVYIHLKSFAKSEAELDNHFDKWLFFLKNLESFDQIPTILNQQIFQQGFETAKIANMSKAHFSQYEASRMVYLENRAAFETAREEGLEIGQAQGYAQGQAQGHAQGQAQGHAQGLDEGIHIGESKREISFVEQCYRNHISIQKTAVLTQLPVEHVRALFKEFKTRYGPPPPAKASKTKK